MHLSWHHNIHKLRVKTSLHIQTSTLFKQKHSSEAFTSVYSKYPNIVSRHQTNVFIMFHHPNACSCECMPYLTYLIVPRHLCINAWSYHSMFMAYQRKKRNPSLIFEGQTTSKYGRQRLIGMKKVQNRSILYK